MRLGELRKQLSRNCIQLIVYIYPKMRYFIAPFSIFSSKSSIFVLLSPPVDFNSWPRSRPRPNPRELRREQRIRSPRKLRSEASSEFLLGKSRNFFSAICEGGKILIAACQLSLINYQLRSQNRIYSL
jgi:hypothetical protein